MHLPAQVSKPLLIASVHISKLGGMVVVLDNMRCRFDLPRQKISEVGEWDSLVSRFKGIKGGDE